MRNKKFILTTMLLLVFCCSFLMTGCFGKKSKSNSNTVVPVRFGEFGYNGKYLTTFASKSILPEQAKQILTNNMPSSVLPTSTMSFSPETNATPDKILIDSILSKYSGCQVVTKFYIEGSEAQITKNDYVVGTDLKSMIEENRFAPFSQLVARYVVCFPSLIDSMEELNTEFKESDVSLIAPFTNIFTYHTNERGELVLTQSYRSML